MTPLRVAVFVTNAAGVYGGGRLAAFLLAQCLARAGAEVSFVTNVKPVFYDELRYFGHPGQVALHLTKDFHLGLPGGAFDIVVLIPGQSQDRTFYMGARGFAHRRGARLVLFNFETPNWFNSLAPEARTEDLWLEWRRCLEDGLLVLSNSEQSMRFAKRYYASHPQTTHFDFWHQPINLKALARVQPQFREKRVVCFVRARDPHKGGQDLIDALSDDLRGWTLSLIVGSAKLDDDYREAIQAAARRHGIGVEVKPLLSDTEKFVELKRARMLLYPSLFEGYGIPPIEALASATPCVCYDLPVFREVCGDALLAAPLGSIEGLQENIRRVIQSSPDDWNHLPQAVASVSSILNCGNNALQALERYLAVAKEPLVPMTPLAGPARTGRFRLGDLAFRYEEGSAFVTGWIAAEAPLSHLSATIGDRPVWVQAAPPAGQSRPGTEVRTAFSLHLDQADLAALARGGARLVLAARTELEARAALLPLHPGWTPCPPGRGEFPPPLPPDIAPEAPPRAEIFRATCDEYGVLEFEGWALSLPRVDAVRIWADGQLLGETIPDRASTGVHERWRHYGDAYGGFQLVGRHRGAPLRATPYRAEFLHGGEPLLVLRGHAVPVRRASALLGSDAALLPPGFLEDAARGPLAALVVEDDQPLCAVAGAGLRALLAHLRARGHEVLLLLHGNPQRFADSLPRWRALAEGILLVNPLTPSPMPALPAVLAALAGAAPRLTMLIADRPGLAPALVPLASTPLRRLVLARNGMPAPATPAPPTALLLDATEEAPPGLPELRIGLDVPGLAAQLRLPDAPPPPEGPLLAVDATSGAPLGLLREVLAWAGGEARRRGWRPTLLVDAPPLAPEALLRHSFGIEEEVALLWPASLARATIAEVPLLVQPLGEEPTGAATATALSRAIPVMLWSASPGSDGWAGKRLVTEVPHAPYSLLNALLAGATLPAIR
ncbi:glycosyltransferase [Roseomonas sp. KE2513]|uniref:glycosyltransferase n=1 Tax=Roseomonas sp. KE2513 TaxID=2479202 RepID=UPI0018DFBF3C|nr:glycosyltransferase [Roseomonas sp. KE2513]MBI0534685.1 glycosyltransferase [Roseomonas sp. KE2513]